MAYVLDTKSSAVLTTLLPGFNPVLQFAKSAVGTAAGPVFVDLPPACDADYFFRLWFYDGGERQIHAKLVESHGDDAYFWYRPFELAEFRGSAHDLADAFCVELERLLTRSTRIVQRKGWFFWHFRCEYREGTVWKVIYRDSALRGTGFKPPHTKGTLRTYESAAIARK